MSEIADVKRADKIKEDEYKIKKNKKQIFFYFFLKKKQGRRNKR